MGFVSSVEKGDNLLFFPYKLSIIKFKWPSNLSVGDKTFFIMLIVKNSVNRRDIKNN